LTPRVLIQAQNSVRGNVSNNWKT